MRKAIAGNTNMAPTQKKEYSLDDLEARHNEITALYDLAEELVATVESDFVSNPGAQLDIVEPLIRDISDASDVLSEEFVFIAEGHRSKNPGRASKTRIEAALRKMYASINDYQLRVRGMGKKAQGAVANIADPIVQKIHRQVEKIVVIFLEFIQVSLQSLMNKAELEALKVRDVRVAMMMHQHAMGQQGQ